MKKSIAILRHLYIALFVLISGNISAQKIAEDYVDEFTNHKYRRTSWERFVSKRDMGAFVRFSEKDGALYFEFKTMLMVVFSLDKGNNVRFMLDNKEIIELENTEYTVSCKGCGSIGLSGSALYGVHMRYPIKREFLEKLKAHKVQKIRVYTTDGYYEAIIKEKHAQKLVALAGLL